MTTIFIKGMMCVRCKMAVQTVLDTLNIDYNQLELGKVDVVSPLSPEMLLAIDKGLRYYELEMMSNRKKILAERIKIAIVQIFENIHTTLPVRFSEHLSKTLFYNYTHLSNIFSEVEGSTIERYYMETRLRKAKDLLLSEEYSINNIASELGFTSAAHFCLQFKKMTGSTPGNFRKQITEIDPAASKTERSIDAHDQQ